MAVWCGCRDFDACVHRPGIIRILCQMIRGQVRIFQHHFDPAPSTQFHQHLQRRPVLDVPTCPGVAEIVPGEIFMPALAHAFSNALVVVRITGLPLKTKTHSLPGLHPRTSPHAAFSASVTWWMRRNAAASRSPSVFIFTSL